MNKKKFVPGNRGKGVLAELIQKGMLENIQFISLEKARAEYEYNHCSKASRRNFFAVDLKCFNFSKILLRFVLFFHAYIYV